MSFVGPNRFSSLRSVVGRFLAAARRRAVLVGVVVLIGLATQVAAADEGWRQELWMISTRCVSTCGWECVALEDFDYQRFDCEQGWVEVDKAAFDEASSKDVPTTFFIHGNQLTQCEAIAQGRSLYRVLAETAGDRAFRVVIWSWPTTRIRGRIRTDVQVKAARSDVQAYYLARCVDAMPADVPIAMVGHSFGARVITGSLELLAGGAVCCRGLETTVERPKRAIRAVLVAAAIDNGSLLPCGRYGMALDVVEQMLITRNCCDRVLRWYPRMNRGGRGPHAMGYTGPACLGQLGENCHKVEVLDVSCSVGRGHGWYDYLCSCAVQCRLPWYAFVEPAADEPTEIADEPVQRGEPVEPDPVVDPVGQTAI